MKHLAFLLVALSTATAVASPSFTVPGRLVVSVDGAELVQLSANGDITIRTARIGTAIAIDNRYLGTLAPDGTVTDKRTHALVGLVTADGAYVADADGVTLFALIGDRDVEIDRVRVRLTELGHARTADARFVYVDGASGRRSNAARLAIGLALATPVRYRIAQDGTVTPERGPLPEADDVLAKDLAFLCSPEAAAKRSDGGFFAWVESHIGSAAVRLALLKVKAGDGPDRFITDVRGLLAKAHVSSCATLDKLERRTP